MSMGIALQLLFTGLGVGSIYVLVALGFVLIYRATNVVNFAQEDFDMLGAFSMVVLCVDLARVYADPGIIDDCRKRRGKGAKELPG